MKEGFPMQIKVGFVHNARELAITIDTSGEQAKSQDDYVAEIENFLRSDDNQTLTIEGAKGARYVLVRAQVAYVEVGAESKNSVGFVS
ncbi:DUF3107 domain-containing protein [uncultured Corynebacterium sp.]|uniref:DUF3107 domain-containing protein n=1 Tax=uncultured Corynebacterium sp. TaxID=159447 RepID=UPI0025F47F62|nr:DUF3107 domain-containing protein [uncultured Corynebacterium sp.]